MIRNGDNLYDQLPPEVRRDFLEPETELRERAETAKRAVRQIFEATNQVKTYTCQFEGE